MGHCYQGLPAKVKLKNKLIYILTPYFLLFTGTEARARFAQAQDPAAVGQLEQEQFNVAFHEYN
jgi:hypothetical protein